MQLAKGGSQQSLLARWARLEEPAANARCSDANAPANSPDCVPGLEYVPLSASDRADLTGGGGSRAGTVQGCTNGANVLKIVTRCIDLE